MLSADDNKRLCRVGPGTVMGGLLRQFWLPCLPSRELTSPDGAPKRVRLLGEDLVAFRDSVGRVGLIEAHCPHRGAPLFFGRNEACGLRCAYHGWKFDVSGRCVDMPNEPAGSTFEQRVSARAYACRDVNGIIWAYLGAGEAPPFPAFEVNTLPASHVSEPMLMLTESNWVQALEGDIDSSHIDWVHARLRADSDARGTWHRDKRPRLDVVPTDYGGYYSAQRDADVSGQVTHRITQFIAPCFTMIPAAEPHIVSLRAWVPLDDGVCLLFVIRGRLNRPISDEERRAALDPFSEWDGYVEATSDPRTRYYTRANRHNDYCRSTALAQELVLGVPFLLNLQDRVMTEGMGRMVDRTREHLGTTDAMIIHVRRYLLTAARALRERGVAPRHVHDVSLHRVRPASVVLPDEDDWIASTDRTRRSDAGAPVAWGPFA